jgi:hypothetical protein
VLLNAAVPGRVRLHIPGWGAAQLETLERRLSMVPGVRKASATPETGNVLLLYDPAVTDPSRLLRAAESALTGRSPKPRSSERPRPTPAARASGQPASAPSCSPHLVRVVLLHLPAFLGLLLSVLTCSTPLGAARLGLEAVQLAIQIGAATA